MKLTEKEPELIEAIRNLKRTNHNYSFELELWVRELFDNLLSEKQFRPSLSERPGFI
jgi:hypothetical protein